MGAAVTLSPNMAAAAAAARESATGDSAQHAPFVAMPRACRVAALCAAAVGAAASAVRSSPGFASFADFGGTPYAVAFDNRSITLNGERTLLLSAGWHYPRLSPGTWDDLLDKVVADGFNQVQTYVFWYAHQWREAEWDWTTFNLTDWIVRAGRRGLFVNLRIG